MIIKNICPVCGREIKTRVDRRQFIQLIAYKLGCIRGLTGMSLEKQQELTGGICRRCTIDINEDYE